MLQKILLPWESQLHLDSVKVEEETIIFAVSSTRPQAECPCCGTLSERIHSHYQRHPADLPIVGVAVRFAMNVRRFFCLNTDCERTIFTERIPSVLAPYARRTHRLQDQQLQTAFALGGEASARLLTLLRMPTSHDTLLRMIRSAPEDEVTTPRVLGVDDWAKRKGHSYGTILVDLETRRPVDLLPDRKAASLEVWLKEHPGVYIISRDRSQEYIKGATDGAPNAIQVADRWHLLKNLRDNLKEWLETKQNCLKAAADESNKDESEQEANLSDTDVEPQPKKQQPKTTEEPKEAKTKLSKTAKLKLVRQAKRLKRYETVKQMSQQGFSKAFIARCTNLDPKTIRRYINAESCPRYNRGTRASKLDPYKEYIRKRFRENGMTATQILDEIQKLGYCGGRTIMMGWVRKTLRTPRPPQSKSSPKKVAPENIIPWTASRASWLLMKPEEDFSEDDKQAFSRMKQEDVVIVEAYSLSQRFLKMIKERLPQALVAWLEDAKESGIDGLKRFAQGIKEDFKAVRNALSFEWSQGQVEGQVNRLKLIKRQMYGRANFDLLRKRVLASKMRC